MATITKRGDTFRIKVSLGYDTEHKQIIKSTTFKPPQGVTPKKAEKLAQQFAYEFESRCKDYTELHTLLCICTAERICVGVEP